MENIICRLCLNIHHELVLIDEATKLGLDVLSVRMNFDVSNDPLMCKNCMETIKRLLSFILAYLDSEKSMLLHNTVKDEEDVDPRCSICIKKKDENSLTTLDVLMNENMLRMDQNVVENPLICFHCRDNVERYIEFLRRCCDTEQKIETYRQKEGTRSTEKMLLSNVLQQFFKVKKEEMDDFTQFEFINIYNSGKECNIKLAIKDEEIISLRYQNSGKSDHVWCTCEVKNSSCLGCCANLNDFPLVSENIKIETVSTEINGALKIDLKTLDTKDKDTLSDIAHPQSNTHKFGICICNKTRKRCSKCNSLFEIVSTGPNVYKCKLCLYQGVSIKSHMLTHRNISEVTMYKCTACDFETKHKGNLKYHALVHKTETDLTMYNCTTCDYKTKHKNCLKRHSLIHKTEAEVTMYKCTACDYKTVRKNDLKIHMLIHKTEIEVTMYKCTVCDFKTKHKGNIKCHSMIHKTEADLTMYNCMACEYKTIHKSSLKRHSLIHKTKAEVTMYQCTVCDFKTKRNNDLKIHMLIHKTEVEVTMYKCTTCDYKTMRKNNLKRHMLTHKTEAEITMYTCVTCGFKTIYRDNFKKHSVIHKTDAEVTMYKCTACDFRTKHKNNLKNHSFRHHTVAEVKM